MLMTILLIVGLTGTMFLGYSAISGPSQRKALKRRIEALKERHGDVIAASAQAQIRKLMARQSKAEGFASSIIPKPALLRARLERNEPDSQRHRASFVFLCLVLGHLACLGASLVS